MKRIILVRHAKSSWKYPELSDIERPLNSRGKHNAPLMAERLKSRQCKPDRVISSPANRAQMTARAICAGLSYQWDAIEINDHLYFLGWQAMLDVIRELDSTINTVMLVGHNPDMTQLLNHLAGHVTDNMPTCAIAELQTLKEWHEVGQRDCELVDFDYPKKT